MRERICLEKQLYLVELLQFFWAVHIQIETRVIRGMQPSIQASWPFPNHERWVTGEKSWELAPFAVGTIAGFHCGISEVLKIFHGGISIGVTKGKSYIGDMATVSREKEEIKLHSLIYSPW